MKEYEDKSFLNVPSRGNVKLGKGDVSCQYLHSLPLLCM